MEYVTGGNSETWHPVITANTMLATYWLNWRFVLCTIWVLLSVTIASILIWKHERPATGDGDGSWQDGKRVQEPEPTLYSDETWRPCLHGIHPAWLLLFRAFAFLMLLVLLVFAVLIDGSSLFYYYTQWTFTLVTIYFGLGVVLSMNGCLLHHKLSQGDKIVSNEAGLEQGHSHTVSNRFSQPATRLDYAFQIIYQVNAGAVMLTDCVFWFIMVPFLTSKDYHLSALTISMHSMNAVFLYGDAIMNCLSFPWFRIAYFFLWTIVYVLFQWILHSSFDIWWPYPFLDLSSSYSPLWYLMVGVMHLPCYGVFSLIVKAKQFLLSKRFPNSYQRFH